MSAQSTRSAEVFTLADLFQALRKRLQQVEDTLAQVRMDTESERVRLLCAELLEQQRALQATVGRIESRQRTVQLSRPVAQGAPFETPEAFHAYWDSRAVTAWVLNVTAFCTSGLNVILERRRLGRAKAALVELRNLLAAHGRRVAVEAQRFEDL